MSHNLAPPGNLSNVSSSIPLKKNKARKYTIAPIKIERRQAIALAIRTERASANDTIYCFHNLKLFT